VSEDLNNIEFDKHIQERYAEHAISPPDNLWSQINNEAALLETGVLRKRVVFYKWLSFSLIALLGGVVILYQLNNNDKIPQGGLNDSKNIIEQNKNDFLVKEDKETLAFKNSERITSDEINPTSTSQNNNEKLDNYIHSEIKNNIKTKEIAITNTENESAKTPYPVFNDKQITSRTNNNDTITSKEPLPKNEEIVNLPSLIIDEKKIENESNANYIIDSLTTVIVDLTQQLEKQDSVLNTDSNFVEIAESSNNNAIVPPIIPEKTLSRITVSALFLPTYSYRSLKNGANAADFYNKNQRVKIQYNTGLNVGYNITDKWTVRLGVNYSKLTNEYELNNVRPNELPIVMDPDNKSITVNSSLGTIVVNNLSEFEFAGDDEDDYELDDEDDFASLTFKEEQKFTFLHFPITIGYELGKGKIKLVVDAGIVISSIIGSSSKIDITNINKPENSIEIKDYHNTKGFYVGGIISLGAKYDLTKRFSLLLIPTYNNSFTNINKDHSSKIKPYSINFTTGLQYRF